MDTRFEAKRNARRLSAHTVVFCLLFLCLFLLSSVWTQALAAGETQTVAVGTVQVAADCRVLDASAMKFTVAELLEALPRLPRLREINFIDKTGECSYTAETVSELDALRTAWPALHLRLSFTLFGQTVSSESEEIEFYRVPIGNEGMEQLRAVAPYLRACRHMVLDGCGIDDALVAQFREDFPALGVVWRIWFTREDYSSQLAIRTGSVMSDTERVRIVSVNDQNCALLSYCNETRYLDVGHDIHLSDFSFLADMPKLEACIIALTKLSDLSALANCAELEYLEVFSTFVTDLSPLSSCTKLRHLNISNLPGVTDIGCLDGLELERLRAVRTSVPNTQFEEYARLHPDCEVMLKGRDPTGNGWRYLPDGTTAPRYALLREQMCYDEDRAYGIL